MIDKKVFCRFSVICTNYNKEPYIDECISSVLDQTFTDFEFIIVDDASTDGSKAIIKKYGFQHPGIITVIENKTNLGMAAGYNKAIAIAKGAIVCLIDSDDFWFKDKLKVVDEYFKLHENCVMHQHPLQIFNFASPTKEYYRPYLVGGNMVEYIKETKQIPLYVATTGLSFKCDLLKKVLPIPLEFSKNGEAFLTRTVICFGEVGLTFIPLGGYRRTDTNVVFGNSSWDSRHYVENILKPALNLFYERNNVDLNFPPALKKKRQFSDFVKQALRLPAKIKQHLQQQTS